LFTRLIGEIRSRWIKQAKQVVGIGKNRNEHKILVGKTKGKIMLERTRREWTIILKWI
jgi:hypothetical protein